jgi:ribonuclease HI
VPEFQVYTDGSCYTGDRIGAWAYVIPNLGLDGTRLWLSGQAARDTTISRMELLGPLEALLFIYDEFGPSYIKVHSDSQYVVLGITNRKRARRKNNDLWDDLDLITDSHVSVKWVHVKGHAGDKYNELCDDHAGKLRRKLSEADMDAV